MQPKAASLIPDCAGGADARKANKSIFARHRVVADLKTPPLWLIRVNTILLWFNPGLSLIAVALALLVIAAAGERSAGNSTNAAPQVARLIDAPSSDLCRPSTPPPELRDLRLYD
ncbi:MULTISPECIES: hypothetical protein [Bradyrhizobium]|uniref:hypothetical protein n=1 Tax=Bradyrhizobium TaxID=374 RepID=UPI00115F9C5E|nr:MULTISPECIES: hypothetical protein [Bradyrhizobium]